MKIIISFILSLSLAVAVIGQQGVVPFVSHGVVVGGVENGKWLSAKETVSLIDSKIEMFLIGPDGLKKEALIGTKSDMSEVCEETRFVDFDGGVYPVAVGSNISWDPFPRRSRPISVSNKDYQKAVSDVLKAKGIASPKVKITQIFQVDLEGDGTDEVLITANYYKGGEMEVPVPGDYAFTLLRKIVDGKPQNVILNGEFFTEPDDYPPPNTREIAFVADLNGDGKMEVWLNVHYYEGHWNEIIEVNETNTVVAVTMECGL